LRTPSDSVPFAPILDLVEEVKSRAVAVFTGGLEVSSNPVTALIAIHDQDNLFPREIVVTVIESGEQAFLNLLRR